MKINLTKPSFLKKKLIKDSLGVLLIRVFGVLFFFLLSLFLTNTYSPQLVGQYDFVRSLIMIFGGICLLGTNQSIIFYSGALRTENSIESLSQVYWRMVKIIVSTSILFIIVYSLLDKEIIDHFFNKKGVSVLVGKVVYTLSFFVIVMLNIDMLRALNKTFASEIFRNILRYLPFFLLVIFLSYKGLFDYIIEAYLFNFFGLSILSTVLILRILRKRFKRKGTVELGYKEIILKSYPMALSALSYFLMQSIDILLLSKYNTFDSVAYYSVAVKLATVTALALQSVNIILAPKIAEVYTKKDFPSLDKLVRNGARLIFALSLPTLLLLGIMSKFTLSLFGEEYIEANNSLLVLLLGQLFNSLCGPVAIFLNMTGKQKVLQRILALGFLINLILNLILIPVYGMIGAASATAISMVIWNLIATAYAYKKDRIKTFLS